MLQRHPLITTAVDILDQLIPADSSTQTQCKPKVMTRPTMADKVRRGSGSNWFRRGMNTQGHDSTNNGS
ncbi:hypothetical protein SUGI_0090870 [Cryptomeria japonica]|nr:hypothetical protein SUGI_0090870 [Cryptomeria japonica]